MAKEEISEYNGKCLFDNPKAVSFSSVGCPSANMSVVERNSTDLYY